MDKQTKAELRAEAVQELREGIASGAVKIDFIDVFTTGLGYSTYTGRCGKCNWETKAYEKRAYAKKSVTKHRKSCEI